MENERLTAVNSPPPPDYKRLSAKLLEKLLADATERIKALEGKPPWETTEACAEALREQLAARVEDAKIADELATSLRAVTSGYQDHDVAAWKAAEAALTRYDATQETPPYMGLSPSSAATDHHPLKEDPNGR